MLSRVAFASARGHPCRQLLAVRYAASTPASATAPINIPIAEDGPERDLVNFPRPLRPEFPAKVRMGIIPEDWFQFFYKKTGVTGPYTFGVGLLTYLFSKEIYVIEHEFFSGISLAILCIIIVKKLGPGIAKFADKGIDELEANFRMGRENQISSYTAAVSGEQKSQWQAEGQKLLLDAKRENVNMQLEAVYREHLMNAFSEVKRRLDYQVERLNIDRRISQKHMVSWIVSNVLKSVTPQQEKESLQKCIADLKGLAART